MESREHRTPVSGLPSTPPPNSSPREDLELQEIELEERLNLFNKQALHLARSGRPENTKKAYKPRQKEWREFCTHQKFPDGAQVTEKKLIYFLETEVVNRQIRPSRYQQNRTTAATDGKCIKQTLGISSIRGYIAAIVDLWSFQKNYGENQHPNPRGDALTSLLASYTRRETARKREQFLDRAAGTLQDGYNHDKMLELVQLCWQGWMMQEKRHRKPQAVESYLCTVVDFLLSHNMLLRGESRRMLEFADLFTIFLPHEGPTPCWPMIMITNNGKTNPFGRLEYMWVMRHCDPLLCTMGQTAFYLFYRWNIVQEPPPQFRQRQQWYGLHLLRGTSQGDRPISYEIQLEWINRVFAAINMTTLKKTHIGRSQGARQAELQGVEEGQIRRAGQWNNDALSNCYLTHLPQKFLRTMAGFEPSNQGNYYLPRAKIVPPRALVQAVWPWVDEWLDWFKSFNGQEKSQDSREDEQQGKEEDHNDMAAQGFLQLLDQLRTILLQDSVLLREQFPHHPIWKDPVFTRGDYQEFVQQMKDSLSNTETPEEVRLQQALPAIAQRLNVVRQDVSQVMNEWGSKTQRQLQEIGDHLDDIIAGRIAFTVRALDMPIPASVNPYQTPPLAPLAPLAAGGIGSGISPVPPPFSGPFPPFQPAPVYLLSRTIETVPDLWREWTCGLGGNNPSVQSLEERYGATWRPSQSERVMFSRRKVIIDEIYARHHRGTPLNTAVEEVELVRTRGRLLLYRLSQLLRKGKAADK